MMSTRYDVATKLYENVSSDFFKTFYEKNYGFNELENANDKFHYLRWIHN